MIYKNIGTDRVSAIGYGTHGVYKDEHVDCIKHAIDCGVNFIDSAESYSNGDSETILGRAIKDIRKKVFVATKVSPENLSYDDVLQSCHLSLNRLNTDYIDLYQIHWPNSSIRLYETLSAMQLLIKTGYVRYIGVSNMTLGQLKESRDILGDSLVSIQNEYNIIERTAEYEMIPFCEEHGIILISYSPYKFLRYVENFSHQDMISWIISHPNAMTLVKSLDKNHISVNCNNIQYKKYYKKDVVIGIKYTHIPINEIYGVDNNAQYIPTPENLASDIKKYGILKPIKVIKHDMNCYEIIEGKLRFLAWCIAKPNKRIPAIVLNNHLSPKHDEDVDKNK